MKNRMQKIGTGLAVLPLMLAANAHAALPAAASTAFTNIGTAVDDVEAAIWPVLGAVIVAFTIIKLVKRGASKV